MPDQKAIIIHDAESEREHLILSVGLLSNIRAVEGDTRNALSAAWVVPVPSEPEVETASADWFAYLGELTRPRLETRIEYVHEREVEKGIESDVAPVKVISREQVGCYDVSILSANEPGALLDWLNDHGYAFPAKGGPVLDTYVEEEGWYFVAVRVLPGERPNLEGDTQPLWLSFDAERPVYPMRLTSLMEDRMHVLIYVLSDHRVVISGTRFETEFAGVLTLSPGRTKDHSLEDLLTGRPYYVTKLRAVALRPAEMSEDLYPERADSDKDYREVSYVTKYVRVRPTATPTPVSLLSQILPKERYGFACGVGIPLASLLIVLGIVAWYWRSRWHRKGDR
jgi:hypothetical protein